MAVGFTAVQKEKGGMGEDKSALLKKGGEVVCMRIASEWIRKSDILASKNRNILFTLKHQGG